MRFLPKSLVLVGALAAAGLAQAADIKIGVAAALTGGAAQYGVAIRNGFQLAADEINAKGGVNGNKIQLVVEDEQGKKEEGINVFKKLIFQDKVLMVFGPTLSNSMFAAGPVANGAKTVVFGTSVTANGITDIGPYVFRNSVMESDVLPVTVATATKHYKLKQVAVIYGNDDAFTKSGYDVFKKVLEDQKLPVTTTETYVKGDVDFKAQLTKIKASNPDAVICSCLAEEAANIMLQARGLGIKVPFIGGNGFNSPKLFEISKLAGEGTFVGSPWSNTNPAPANKAFVAAYVKKYNAEPNQFAAQAFDALHVAAAALQEVKLSGDIAADREALKNALPKATINGATGPFKFRPAVTKSGKPGGWDADQKPFIYVVKGGKFTAFDGK
ncbi:MULTISPECIES: ABC transporter substrate-binding protein [Azospira]|jgi:branched-chain amino acid transport system substrate-binding protein|uniref:ABC-type branched-chain amino acid transport system, periplasmic component n=2 Tax=Azospira oryzae TaxID=146939 RepID=G8QIM0_AZOOP|nr:MULTISPECIES: ABC transporter substrate-binding protein [Azospira]TLS18996.1 MAG: ABC transporter substrate-binding protein [Betaproteobacteria bacterium]AEV26432.1 ABC-type branched-chain amino acid transport system, periplasmic component [Azospira oryzae PS]MDK9690163.1 ABC transporter substrate-binding protein [Azospira sp.]RZT89472.1 amino acid/amide ABC transporter substrate-binding protein (HAAT family) [Azospira oryzae]BBN88153.1 branched-chain amino acid ABC transporter substrate-bi